MGFEAGNSKDGKHYWLTPDALMDEMDAEFDFDHDACPYPKPDDYDGLTAEWGQSTYVNPPFGAIMQNGKKKGQTAWARKAIEEHKKGKKVVMVYPIDKWVLMCIEAGAEIRNLKDVRWLATEDRSEGTGRHIAQFIFDPTAKEKKDEALAEKISSAIMNSDQSILEDEETLYNFILKLIKK